MLHGDLGTSIATGRPVSGEVGRAVVNSLILAVVATLIGFTFGTFFVVEIGPADTVLGLPGHPYTEALLSSMPSLDPDARTETPPLAGDPPNPIDPPSGCRFHPRCRLVEPVCGATDPPLDTVSRLHRVACLARQPGSGHSLAPAAARAAA